MIARLLAFLVKPIADEVRRQHEQEVAERFARAERHWREIAQR